MQEIIRILCGSHLYGVAVPESDEDVKMVFIPPAEKILLGTVRDADNSKGENQDLESFSLQFFLKLLVQGQPNGLDMLFAPPEFYRSAPSPIWLELLENKDQLLSKRSTSFVEYCRQQAKKYVVRKERLRAVDNAVGYLTSVYDKYPNPAQVTLREVDTLESFAAANNFTEMVSIETAQGSELKHLSVCQTMVPVTASVKLALSTYKRKAEEYGRRMRRAVSKDTTDWKSLYHAVRIAEEAIELMETGKITFPRPEKELLLQIRLGKIPFEEVSAKIEENLLRVEEAVQNSSLPEVPNHEFAQALVLREYRKEVLNSRP